MASMITGRALGNYLSRLQCVGQTRSLASAAKASGSSASRPGVLAFIDGDGGAGATRTGRAWRSTELRLKSYDDLHKLWFILLKERNVLLTEKEWCRSNGRHWVNGNSNIYKVKRSMARIKGVIGERARALKAKREFEDRHNQEKSIEGLTQVADLASSPKTPTDGVRPRGL